MYRHPYLDLGYTHEITASVPHEPIPAPIRTSAARDLTARLRCLKKLADAERAERLGPCMLMALRSKPARVSANPRQRGMH